MLCIFRLMVEKSNLNQSWNSTNGKPFFKDAVIFEITEIVISFPNLCASEKNTCTLFSISVQIKVSN